MRKFFTIGKYDFDFSTNARRSYLKPIKFSLPNYNGWHLVWGRFSLVIEDWTEEVYRVCKHCDSGEIKTITNYDESLDICESCEQIEPDYYYVNKHKMEELE